MRSRLNLLPLRQSDFSLRLWRLGCRGATLDRVYREVHRNSLDQLPDWSCPVIYPTSESPRSLAVLGRLRFGRASLLARHRGRSFLRDCTANPCFHDCDLNRDWCGLQPNAVQRAVSKVATLRDLGHRRSGPGPGNRRRSLSLEIRSRVTPGKRRHPSGSGRKISFRFVRPAGDDPRIKTASGAGQTESFRNPIRRRSPIAAENSS